MPGQYDFKKEWKKTKIQLAKFSQEAVAIAKKGEKEFFELSRKSKLYLDTKSISFKKEHLHYLIGKEYVKLKDPVKPTAKLTQLVNDLKKADKEQRSLERKLKLKKK